MLKVGVLRGGIEKGFEKSMKDGAFFIDALKRSLGEEVEVVDILLTKEGEWLRKGFAIDPRNLSHEVDVVFNSLKGELAHSGHLTDTLREFGIKINGSDKVSSAIANNVTIFDDYIKSMGEKSVNREKISLADYDSENKFLEMARFISLKYSPPWIIKPVNSFDREEWRAKSFPQLIEVLEEFFNIYNEGIIEEWQSGDRIRVGVFENFRGENLYTLPIMLCEDESGNLKRCPHVLDRETSEEIKEKVKNIFKSLGIKGHAFFDLKLHPKRGVFFDRVDTGLSLDEESHLVQAMSSVGVGEKELVSHIINNICRR